MPDMKYIFNNRSAEYDRLVSREDYQGNLLKCVRELIGPSRDKILLDLGTGTGRIARVFAPYFRKVLAFDASTHMIEKAVELSDRYGIKNIDYAVGTHSNIPLENDTVDVVIQGWSFCCIRAWNEQTWEQDVSVAFREIERVLKRPGKAVMIETLGTMTDKADPPGRLGELYAYYEEKAGCTPHVIRTDYRFADLDEAVRLCAFFFGDETGRTIRERRLIIVPEFTGIWYKEY